MVMRLGVVTLCSGYDSQCLALERLKSRFADVFDYELLAWAEIDRYAIEAHDVLFPEYGGGNMGDITTCDWSALNVDHVDLLTYSTPCQSISVAGRQEGLKKGSGTASSVIWSVLRAIDVLRPKYLLMENVKALISNKFIGDFREWQNELSRRGYTNFVKVLDAQDYGVPQHRERVFMVSILGDDVSFHFPEPFTLERKLKDVLESNVDEKYYLKENQIKYIFSTSKSGIERQGISDVESPAPIVVSSCYKGNNMICINTVGNLYGDNKQAGRIYDVAGISPTLDNMASGGNKAPKIIEPNFGDSRLNKMLKVQEIPTDEPVCIDSYNQSVIKGVFCTIKANIGTENMKYVTEPLSCAMRGRDLDNPSNREPGCTTGQRLEIGDDKANTITTVQKDSMVVEPQVLTPKRNEYGKVVRKEYKSGKLDEIRHNMTDLTPREDGVSNTITSVQKDNLLCEPRANNISYKITHDGKIRAYQNDDKKSGVSEFQIDNEESVASTVTTAHTPKCYGESMGFRIRKLTPREVFRLMDVDDEDIDKLLASGISNTQLYKMAGNSVVVNCLYHIFRKMFIEKENESNQLTLF